MRYDVAIIGGGVTGCAIARELMHYRVRAVLVERECDVGFGTSKANSGIIHGSTHFVPGTLKWKLGWAGNQKWGRLSEELGFGFDRIGDLTVAFSEEEIDRLREFQWRCERAGVPRGELWGPERVRAEEPGLSGAVAAALFCPSTGVVNPYEACFSLIESARRNGLELRVANPVLGVRTDEDGLWIQTEHELINSRFIINAAGLYADRIAEMAGVANFTITARKGEEYLLDKRLQGIVSRVIYPCPSPTSKGVLVIPTFDGTVMVGPTAEEIDDRADLSTSAAGAAHVFSKVARLAPGIGERDCIAEFAGLRAVSDTEDFVIAATPLPGFINVAGIQSPGLTAAPAIAEMVIEILGEEGLELEPNEDFLPGIDKPVRVATLTTQQRRELATTDPAFAHVVCRCELVTRGEVLDSIRRGARTLDGLKFRTRVGMGRCQGAFCSPRCMQLLSGTLGVPLSAITKRGEGSWLVIDREELERRSGEPTP